MSIHLLSRHPFITAIGVAVIITVGIFTWLVIDEDSDALIFSKPLKIKQINGIQDVKIQIIKSSVVLKVTLDKPLACNQILIRLGIDVFTVNNKSYIPFCITETADPLLVHIVYRETTPV